MTKTGKSRDRLWINIKRTWRYIKPCGWNLAGYAIVSVVEGAVGIVAPIYSAKVILDLTGNLMEQLIWSALAVFGLNMLLSVLTYFKNIFYRKIYRQTLVAMQIDVARETLKIEMSEINKSSSGLFINRMGQDTSEIADLFMKYTYYLSSIVANIGVMIAILILNKYMFAFSIISAIVLFIISKKRLSKQTIIRRKMRKLSESKTGLTGELVRGLADIKVLGAATTLLNKTAKRVESVYDEEYRIQQVGTNYGLLFRSAMSVSQFLYLLLGAYLSMQNLLTIPSFVIIYNYQSKVQTLISGIVRIMEFNKQFIVAADRIYEVIDDDKFAKETYGSTHLDRLNGAIEFKNVSFGYDESKQIISGMSFKIKPNERVAFVGRSGTGKTTLFNLITRLYHVDDGEILLDGHNIEDLDKKTLRDNMSIITQSPYIFNFSIKDNLLIAKSDATMEELRQACKVACIDDYIMSLPDKYDTMVGEGGVILSGGQRQRLAIARALLKDAEIVLFDEATSALDNETQSQIQQAINNMQGINTVLIVAHRLSTVIDSDRIFVVDQGKIVASGNHKQLLKSSELYKELYSKDLQA